MRTGIRLFRAFGISIEADPSWLVIFLLVTWNLAAGVFPSLHPGWPAGLTWMVSIVAALLFFASVVAHELAHSVVARARNIPVRRITLFLFGGVSNIEREPPSAASEFLVAIVGPITSILLGAICLAAAGAATAASPLAGSASRIAASMGPGATLLAWLGSINLMLGIFNLVPGFPLDGGRILRSALWAAMGDLRRATRWASGAGQLVAWLMIFTGISMVFGARVPFFGTGLIGGMWLAFIGWFLQNAAIASYRQVVVHDVLEGVKVGRLMRRRFRSIAPDMPVSTLVYDVLMGTDERAFPVVEGQRLDGIVCVDDVRKIPREEWDATTAAQIMTPADNLELVRPEMDAADAMAALGRRDIGQAPVVVGGQIVGMLHAGDIVRWLQLNAEDEDERLAA